MGALISSYKSWNTDGATPQENFYEKEMQRTRVRNMLFCQLKDVNLVRKQEALSEDEYQDLQRHLLDEFDSLVP